MIIEKITFLCVADKVYSLRHRWTATRFSSIHAIWGMRGEKMKAYLIHW